MQCEAAHLNEDERFSLAWSCGVNYEAASWVAGVTKVAPSSEIVIYTAWSCLRVFAQKRTKSQMRRFVLRNRRRYNRNLASFRRHERAILRPPFEGVRCYGCKHIPPQPGEIMEPDWQVGIGLEEEE